MLAFIMFDTASIVQSVSGFLQSSTFLAEPTLLILPDYSHIIRRLSSS